MVLVLAGARTSLAAPAAADPSASPPSASPPSGPSATASSVGDDGLTPEEMPDGGIPPHSVPYRPWAMFDPYLAPRSLLFTGGPAWERFIGEGYGHPGFEVTVARSIETQRGILLDRLELEFGVRVSNPAHWVASLARYSYAGALALGPVELSGRAGVTVAELHFGSSGFGLGFFSPRVSAGASVSAGPIRIGALAFSEYAWRWIGGPNAFVRGLLLEISLGKSPVGLPPYYWIKN
jgi:hypothetical protein